MTQDRTPKDTTAKTSTAARRAVTMSPAEVAENRSRISRVVRDWNTAAVADRDAEIAAASQATADNSTAAAEMQAPPQDPANVTNSQRTNAEATTELTTEAIATNTPPAGSQPAAAFAPSDRLVAIIAPAMELTPTPPSSPSPPQSGRLQVTVLNTGQTVSGMETQTASALVTPNNPAATATAGQQAPAPMVTNQTDEILARLAAANQRVAANSPRGAQGRSPLSDYTLGPMPPVQDEEPSTPLMHLHPDQVTDWVSTTTGRVLVRPFDTAATNPANHAAIAAEIMTAITDITGSNSVAVSIPLMIDNPLPRTRHPNTFLAYNLTPEQERILLDRGIWSSELTTFQVLPLNPPRPSFLFTLSGFTTLDADHATDLVRQVWQDDASAEFFTGLVEAAPEANRAATVDRIRAFIASMTTNLLDIRITGQIRTPHFNVYANGEVLANDNEWAAIRSYLRMRLYESTMHGRATASADFHCSLCHSVDHPRGLCPFPDLQGWRGGARNPPSDSNKTNRNKGKGRASYPFNQLGKRPPRRDRDDRNPGAGGSGAVGAN
ncbi:hypothetical protein BC834DRAFT_842450 [Gloeopeniophorella convolvens]|nr:hypothetical protein BC834DRAFT_842450 [Gloeopeniophorella convolvens]